jgi:hypothetical protein
MDVEQIGDFASWLARISAQSDVETLAGLPFGMKL